MVTLSAFYMAKTLTTWAEWQTVRTWAVAHGYPDLLVTNDGGGAIGKAADHPVCRVNWYEVVKWCNAKSEMDGLTPCYYTDEAQPTVFRTGNLVGYRIQVKWAANANGYRLPTSEEWECAARGGITGKRFPWGDTISHTQANYNSSASYSYDVSATRGNHPSYNSGDYPYTSPVTAFAANGYGLFDMAGNLGQWCWDRAGDYPNRAVRGGSWEDPATGLAGYFGDYPTIASVYGFRCARSSAP